MVRARFPPRVYCHKQVLLPNYSMTCCPVLLCQSQAQDWLPPPAFDQSPMSHPSFPACTQLRVYSLFAVSSTAAAMFTHVSCGFDTLQKTELIYALQNSSRSALPKKAPAEPEPALTAEVAHAPRASHTAHCLWESTEIHRIWICFEGFPGCQQKVPRHTCAFPQPCLLENPYI